MQRLKLVLLNIIFVFILKITNRTEIAVTSRDTTTFSISGNSPQIGVPRISQAQCLYGLTISVTADFWVSKSQAELSFSYV